MTQTTSRSRGRFGRRWWHDEALSTTAKNIKIITVHGKVILRGPVANAQEKTNIEKTAQQFTKQRVDSQLEVAARH